MRACNSLEEIKAIAKKFNVRLYRRATTKFDRMGGAIEIAYHYESIDTSNLDVMDKTPYDQYYIITNDCIETLQERIVNLEQQILNKNTSGPVV